MPFMPLHTPVNAAKKVIILGAGASKADGAPLQAELFGKYAEIVQRTKSIYRSSEDELRTFFSLFWGADIDDPNIKRQHFPTFEEALGLLEMANTRSEFFKDFGGLYHESSRGNELRSHLSSLIATVLDDALAASTGTHEELITKLQIAGFSDHTTF